MVSESKLSSEKRKNRGEGEWGADGVEGRGGEGIGGGALTPHVSQRSQRRGKHADACMPSLC